MGTIRKHCFIFSYLILLATPSWGDGSFAIKFGLGYYPNLLHQAENPLFFNLQEVNRRIIRRKAAYRNYYGDRVVLKDIKLGGNSVEAIVFDTQLRYYFSKFFFHLGVAYASSLGVKSGYTLITYPGTAEGKTENFYDDYAKNQDQDLENDVPFAKGIVPTGGQEYIYRMYVNAKEVEIPFVMGISVYSTDASNYYIGLGSVFLYGEFVRTIYNRDKAGNPIQGKNGVADTDRFRGAGVGFQFIVGAEKKINKRFGYVAEFALNFGAVLPLLDEVKSNSSTTNSLFHSNREEDLGGSEEIGTITRPGFPKLSGILFSGYRISVGLTFYLQFDKKYTKQVEFEPEKKRRKPASVNIKGKR